MGTGRGWLATKTARRWSSAVVAWALAAAAGMGVAVVAPDWLPQVGPFAVPVGPASSAAAGTPTANAVPGPAGPPAAPTARPATPPTTTATTTPIDAAPGARQRAADRAVDYARSRGWRSGIAVRDLITGETTLAGDAQGYFRADSTLKLVMAARLLSDHSMTPAVEPLARRMLTVSDDAAANALYATVGGDALIGWFGARYGLSDPGTPPVRGAGQWGSTQVTPLAMVTFLAAAYQDRTVGPWLTESMAQLAPIAADGTGQLYGLRAADPAAAVKPGWGGDADPRDVAGTSNVGYVDRGRYAVAIYTARLPETPLAEAQAVLTEQAKTLLPQGTMPRR